MDIQVFNREMDRFGSFVRRSTTDDAESILTDLLVQKDKLIRGSDEYELCASKIFFVEQHIRRRKLTQVKREVKPWNLV